MLWCGGEEPFLDEVSVVTVGRMVVGRYGGTPKNEDAAYARCGEDREYAVLADGHGGADSSALAVKLLRNADSIDDVVPTLLSADTSDLTGETAVLAVLRHDRFLRWLSIGDCAAYALHPDLAALGQYALNQRSYYEWFGRVDSLRLDVPCYAGGVHALRPGRTRIVVVTDGALEGSEPFDAAAFYEGDLGDRMNGLMHGLDGRDSATVIAWDVTAGPTAMWPSA